MSRSLPIPDEARYYLALIPAEFRDDGCSRSPDSLFGFDFRWACRLHDWSYCTRAHPPGSLTYARKVAADYTLREHLKAALPLRWRWVRFIYQGAVLAFGGFGSFNSCGPEAGELCRHAMRRPPWMTA